MQKILIPTISLVFYYGFTNWSLKLRRAQVQNISERVYKIPKVLSKEGGSNRRRRETYRTDKKNSSHTSSLSHFLKTTFHTHIRQLDRQSKGMKPSGKLSYGRAMILKWISYKQAMRMWRGSSGS